MNNVVVQIVGILFFFSVHVARASEPVSDNYKLEAPRRPTMMPSSIETKKNARLLNLRIPAMRGQVLDHLGRPFIRNETQWTLMVRFGQADSFENALAYAQKHVDLAQTILAKKIPFSSDALKRHFENRRWLPFQLAINLSQPEKERLEKEYPASLSANEKQKHLGLTLVPSFKRVYTAADTAAHVLGYVGKKGGVNGKELPLFSNNNEAALDPAFTELQGREGIEKSMDAQLRGQDGVEEIYVDDDQTLVYREPIKAPVDGNNVFLTLDIDWQKYAESLFKKRRGAMVVIDIDTGAIPVLASNPRYNPADFAGGVSTETFDHYLKDTEIPLLPRATLGTYPPGSTFKVVTTLAALAKDYESHDIFGIQWGNARSSDPGTFLSYDVGPRTYLNCGSSYQIGKKSFRNFGDETGGMLNVFDALERSCNTWFFPVGIAAGAPAIIETAQNMGLGKKVGLGVIEESAGKIPALFGVDKFGNSIKRKYVKPDLANIAIGQGPTLLTPLQVANMMNYLATSGHPKKLRLVNEVQNAHGQTEKEFPVTSVDTPPVSSIFANIVANGLYQVVQGSNGTATQARHPYLRVAGKTGTAEWGDKKLRRNVVWFGGFIPFEKPKYAFAVMVEGNPRENVTGGHLAAPIAGAFFKKVLDKSSDLVKNYGRRDVNSNGPTFVTAGSAAPSSESYSDYRPTYTPVERAIASVPAETVREPTREEPPAVAREDETPAVTREEFHPPETTIVRTPPRLRATTTITRDVPVARPYVPPAREEPIAAVDSDEDAPVRREVPLTRNGSRVTTIDEDGEEIEVRRAVRAAPPATPKPVQRATPVPQKNFFEIFRTHGPH